MREILTIFMDYCGNGIYPFLFLAALVYLLVTEKDKRVRLILAETSVVILVLFFFPLFKMVMDRVEEAGTYYRILWLLPMTVVIAYAGVKLIGKHTRIGLVALAAVCILGGSYVYGNVNVSKAENRYHLPAEVPAICDLIMPAEDEERVWAVFPSELVQYIRQYTSEIQMPYGRDMLAVSYTHLDVYKRQERICVDEKNAVIAQAQMTSTGFADALDPGEQLDAAYGCQVLGGAYFTEKEGGFPMVNILSLIHI